VRRFAIAALVIASCRTATPTQAPPPPPGTADAAAPDRDNDGIPDPDDRCPDDPEDCDGFEDNDGCPGIEPCWTTNRKQACARLFAQRAEISALLAV